MQYSQPDCSQKVERTLISVKWGQLICVIHGKRTGCPAVRDKRLSESFSEAVHCKQNSYYVYVLVNYTYEKKCIAHFDT